MQPEELLKRIELLEVELKKLKSFATIPFETEGAFRERLKTSFAPIDYLPFALVTALGSTPFASITSPSGGATVDSQARTAIDTIITRLETAGIVSPN